LASPPRLLASRWPLQLCPRHQHSLQSVTKKIFLSKNKKLIKSWYSYPPVAKALIQVVCAVFTVHQLVVLNPHKRPITKLIILSFRSVAYEEQWADKQERAFVRWINAQLDRVDVFNEAARDPYAAHSNALKRAQVRRMAALLLQAETTRMVFAKIDTVPQILKLKKHLLTP